MEPRQNLSLNQNPDLNNRQNLLQTVASESCVFLISVPSFEGYLLVGFLYYLFSEYYSFLFQEYLLPQEHCL